MKKRLLTLSFLTVLIVTLLAVSSFAVPAKRIRTLPSKSLKSRDNKILRNKSVYAVPLPDALQTFSGYVVNGSVSISPDNFFSVTNSFGKYMLTDEFGAFIEDGALIGSEKSGYIQVSAVGGLGTFKLTAIDVGEYDITHSLGATEFADIYVEGFLSGVSQGVSNTVQGMNNYIESYAINLGGLVNKPIDSYRVYFTAKVGSNFTAFNLTTFSVGGSVSSTVPIVTTTSPATLITSSSATLAGNITSDGGESITDGGVVYSTTSNPTTSDQKSSSGATGIGAISINATGLLPNTLYHYRAYAVNSIGTSYGDDQTFTTASVAPVLSFTAALTAFSSTEGSVSAVQSFDLSGSNLTDDIIATAPSGFELSSDGTLYSNSVTLIESGGTVANTTIFIRLSSSATGTPSGNIALTSIGATTKNIVVSGTVAVPIPPTVNAIVRTGNALTNAVEVNYTVTFSEAVSGVDVDDFMLTSSGTVTGMIASLTGSDDTYTVTVNNLLGDGTLRLDLKSSGTNIQNGSAVFIATGYTSGQTYTFDHTPPLAPTLLAIDSESDSGTLNDGITNVETPVITGTAEANSTVKLYEGTVLLGTTVADGLGNWSITSTTLSLGSHAITAKATDLAGNISSLSAGLSITIDNIRPTLLITSNVSSLKVGETATITFTFSKDPGSTFVWNGTTGNVTVAGGTLGAITGSSLSYTATFSPTANIVGGLAGITVADESYTDVAGNKGVEGSTPYIILNTKTPDAPSTPAISGNPSIITVNTPTFSGTAEAGVTITLYDTNGSTVLGTAIATNGNWSITSVVLAEGSHTVKAKAKDAAGNESLSSNGYTFMVNSVPSIIATGTLTSMSSTYGLASAQQSFTVSGTNLTERITITAASGFEVSKDNLNYSTNLTLGSAGTVSSSTIYVRLAGTAAAGNYNGNIVMSSNGATTVNIATNTTNTIQKAVAIISFSNLSTTYDGTPKAVTATTIPSGITGVTITYGDLTTTPSAVGTYAVVASLDHANYTAIDATGSLVISPKVLTVTATASNKNYDGTTDATVMLADNRINGDLFTTSYTAAFNNKNVGIGKTVNVTGITISGGASANYTLGNTVTTAIANIIAKTINVTAQAKTKVYGSNDPELTYEISSGALVNGDVFNGALTRDAGDQVNTYAIKQGTLELNSNYTLNYTQASLNITPATLTIKADDQNKVYGQANPALTLSYSGFVNGDSQSNLTTQATASTTAIAATAPGDYIITTSGASSDNYSIRYVNGNLKVLPLAKANLASLSISSGALSPVFTPEIFAYTAQEAFDVSSITLTPTFDATATILINGISVPSGSPSYNIPLVVGNNTITLVVTAQDGLTKSTYMLTVNRALPSVIEPTNIMSPNGDGKNDTWIIKNIELYPKNTVTVYDKGGRVIYSKRGYNNDWDGTIQGAALSQGTYYYIVDLGLGTQPIRGFITILRSR